MTTITSSSFRWFVGCALFSGVASSEAKADFSFPDFTNPTNLVLVGDAATVGGVLRVIPGLPGYVKGAAWFTKPQGLASGFETWFRFRLSGGVGSGDGFAFVIQGDSLTAIGLYGLGLGYSSGPEFQLCQDADGIAQSVAVEFDTYYNPWISDLPVPHVSIQTRGPAPNCADHGSSLGATTRIPDILVGDHTALIRYAPGTMSIFVDDLLVLEASVDLGAYPALDNGWVGFTSGAGSAYRDTDILTWTFAESPSTCPSPSLYCSAKLNSLGCTPSIGWQGLPMQSGAADDFWVTASNVRNNKLGMLLWSMGPANNPFFGGTLCVAQPIHRTPAQYSAGNSSGNDCTGTYSFHFSQVYMLQQLLGANITVFAQYWSRDPGFAPPNNIGLTDGLRFTICP